MKIRWILSREAAADIAALLGRRVPLAELRPRHQLRLEDGQGRPIWRLGNALQRLYLVTMEDHRSEPGVLIRTIVEAKKPHEGYSAPGRGRPAPTGTHAMIARLARAHDIDVSQSDVRDMDPDARRALLVRCGLPATARGADIRAAVRARETVL